MRNIVFLLSMILSLSVFANPDEFVEIVTEEEKPLSKIPDHPPLEVGQIQTEESVLDQPVFQAQPIIPQPIAQQPQIATLKHFTLNQGLLKNNIENLTAQFYPTYSIVWQVDQRLEQYADLTLSGTGYEDILEQIVKQFGLGACIRGNNVVEIYDILNNRFYCED